MKNGSQLKIQGCGLEIIYIQGTHDVVANAVSRLDMDHMADIGLDDTPKLNQSHDILGMYFSQRFFLVVS